MGILAASDPSFVVRHCSASLCATLDRLGAETNGFADIEVCGRCVFGGMISQSVDDWLDDRWVIGGRQSLSDHAILLRHERVFVATNIRPCGSTVSM